MNLHNIQFAIGASVLLAFISIAVFGLLPFRHIEHVSEAPMANCPYSLNGSSLCENNFTHIENWQQFFETISPLLFFTFLILGIAIFLFPKNFLDDEDFYRQRRYLDNPKLYSPQSKIIHWLSLFENSPSFAR